MMATYYVSANGNNDNDGLSPQTAWATPQHAVATAGGGHTILLKAGDTFYGGFRVPDAESPDHPTVIDAYGEGAKPAICCYKKVVDAAVWEQVSPQIWRVNLFDETQFVGNTVAKDNNVGFIYVDGAIRGFKYYKLEDVRTLWDFYCDYDSGYVYVHCPRNPNYYDQQVCFAVGGGVSLGTNSRVSNLDIFGGGSHGMTAGHSAKGCLKNAVASNCDIHDFGGAQLRSEEHFRIIRFGNGIEFWSGAEDVLVENCRIYNIYDVAITMQGFPEKNGGWKNVVFRQNAMWGNHQSFEIWTKDEHAKECGMTNCKFTDNICIGAGYGWSYYPRHDRQNGSHLLFYCTNVDKHDILVENNVFYDMREVLYHKSIGAPVDGEIPTDYVTRGNHIFIRKDAYLMNQKYCYRATELEAFQQERGLEMGSDIHYLVGEKEPSIDKMIVELAKYILKDQW